MLRLLTAFAKAGPALIIAAKAGRQTLHAVRVVP